MLTGLWKVDEQASAILLEAFYENLTKGLEKDEALRQAKLYYLENRSGRMLAPHYWAGLEIMGDTAAINLQQNSNISLMLIFGVLLVLLGGYYIYASNKSLE